MLYLCCSSNLRLVPPLWARRHTFSCVHACVCVSAGLTKFKKSMNNVSCDHLFIFLCENCTTVCVSPVVRSWCFQHNRFHIRAEQIDSPGYLSAHRATLIIFRFCRTSFIPKRLPAQREITSCEAIVRMHCLEIPQTIPRRINLCPRKHMIRPHVNFVPWSAFLRLCSFMLQSQSVAGNHRTTTGNNCMRLKWNVMFGDQCA